MSEKEEFSKNMRKAILKEEDKEETLLEKAKKWYKENFDPDKTFDKILTRELTKPKKSNK